METDATIVALATPPGRGGLGIVRLSGGSALRIATLVLRDNGGGALSLTPRHAQLAEFLDSGGAVMDRAIALYFQKPHSYTGEDVVEISCHGAPVVLSLLLERCLESGARLAAPGEFTMRAFLNGRMDLAQAEAVRDLIDSQTLYQAKVAAQQMDGAVARWLTPAKKELVDLIALLEAGIDFAEDDVGVLDADQIAARLQTIEAELTRLANSYRAGKIVQHGLTLAIVGRPNVGKSSLFNCLLQRDRAIVTAHPGTTRDLVSETAEVGGIPLRFVDTAGVREAFDEAEAIGVRKSFEAAVESDLTLLVLDGSSDLASEDRNLLARLAPLGKLILIVNKSDLPPRLTERHLRVELATVRVQTTDGTPPAPIVFASALRQEGMEALRLAILQAAAPALSASREPQFLTNLRQEALVRDALTALQVARIALGQEVPHEMLLLDLYGALRPLNEITGETTTEDILTQIFSTFCIGK